MVEPNSVLNRIRMFEKAHEVSEIESYSKYRRTSSSPQKNAIVNDTDREDASSSSHHARSMVKSSPLPPQMPGNAHSVTDQRYEESEVHDTSQTIREDDILVQEVMTENRELSMHRFDTTNEERSVPAGLPKAAHTQAQYSSRALINDYRKNREVRRSISPSPAKEAAHAEGLAASPAMAISAEGLLRHDVVVGKRQNRIPVKQPLSSDIASATPTDGNTRRINQSIEPKVRAAPLHHPSNDVINQAAPSLQSSTNSDEEVITTLKGRKSGLAMQHKTVLPSSSSLSQKSKASAKLNNDDRLSRDIAMAQRLFQNTSTSNTISDLSGPESFAALSTSFDPQANMQSQHMQANQLGVDEETRTGKHNALSSQDHKPVSSLKKPKPQPSDKVYETKTMRLRNLVGYQVPTKAMPHDLRRNLDAASVVIEETKSGSIASSNASSLSFDELGNVARKALELSSVEDEKNITDRRNRSAISQMLSHKRVPKVIVNSNADELDRNGNKSQRPTTEYNEKRSSGIANNTAQGEGYKHKNSTIDGNDDRQQSNEKTTGGKLSRAERLAALRKHNKERSASQDCTPLAKAAIAGTENQLMHNNEQTMHTAKNSVPFTNSTGTKHPIFQSGTRGAANMQSSDSRRTQPIKPTTNKIYTAPINEAYSAKLASYSRRGQVEASEPVKNNSNVIYAAKYSAPVSTSDNEVRGHIIQQSPVVDGETQREYGDSASQFRHRTTNVIDEHNSLESDNRIDRGARYSKSIPHRRQFDSGAQEEVSVKKPQVTTSTYSNYHDSQAVRTLSPVQQMRIRYENGFHEPAGKSTSMYSDRNTVPRYTSQETGANSRYKQHYSANVEGQGEQDYGKVNTTSNVTRNQYDGTTEVQRQRRDNPFQAASVTHNRQVDESQQAVAENNTSSVNSQYVQQYRHMQVQQQRQLRQHQQEQLQQHQQRQQLQQQQLLLQRQQLQQQQLQQQQQQDHQPRRQQSQFQPHPDPRSHLYTQQRQRQPLEPSQHGNQNEVDKLIQIGHNSMPRTRIMERDQNISQLVNNTTASHLQHRSDMKNKVAFSQHVGAKDANDVTSYNEFANAAMNSMLDKSTTIRSRNTDYNTADHITDVNGANDMTSAITKSVMHDNDLKPKVKQVNQAPLYTAETSALINRAHIRDAPGTKSDTLKQETTQINPEQGPETRTDRIKSFLQSRDNVKGAVQPSTNSEHDAVPGAGADARNVSKYRQYNSMFDEDTNDTSRITGMSSTFIPAPKELDLSKTNSDQTQASKSSSDSKPDAFRWWKKNYGKFANITSPILEKSTKRKAETTPVRPAEQDVEEDDDIFFGLDDESQCDDREDPVMDSIAVTEEKKDVKNAKMDNTNNSIRTHIMSAKKVETSDNMTSKVVNPPPNAIIAKKPITKPLSGGVTESYRKRDTKENVETKYSKPVLAMNEKVPQARPKEVQRTKVKSAVTKNGRSGMLLDESKAIKTVSSDITSSLIAGRRFMTASKRSRVATILEEQDGEEQKAVIDNKANTETDDQTNGPDTAAMESVVQSNSDSDEANAHPQASVFLNFGYAIVDSFQNACKVPDKLISYQECTDKVHHEFDARCRIDETQTMDDNTINQSFSLTQYTDVHSTTIIPEVPITDETEERNDDGDDWRRREKSAIISERPSTLRDEPSLYKESEDDDASEPTASTIAHGTRRIDATNRLLEHAKRAMAVVHGIEPSIDEPLKQVNDKCDEQDDETNGNAETAATDTVSGHSEVEDGEASAYSSLQSSNDHHSVLEQFSYTLRHEGIEILKLNRWNKWQTRYLTVSREDTDESEQLPKALLWLKNSDAVNRSALSVKSGGRGGGLLFAQLKSADPIEDTSSLQGQIPSKFKQDNPEFTGALVVFELEGGGGDRSLQLCFRNNSDAMSFCLAMRIIKEVTKRQGEIMRSE